MPPEERNSPLFESSESRRRSLAPLVDNFHHLRYGCNFDTRTSLVATTGDLVLIQDLPVPIRHIVNVSLMEKRLDLQGPGKVAVCTKCPNMPVAGIWLPAWINAVVWRRATTWVIGQMGTNRDFAGALPRSATGHDDHRGFPSGRADRRALIGLWPRNRACYSRSDRWGRAWPIRRHIRLSPRHRCSDGRPARQHCLW